MYHISCDKRALDSAHRIRLALEKLLDTNPFESITVSQICAAAEVSRTTFYRLFDIPEDIIRWYCDNSASQLIAALKKEDKSVLELPFQFNVRYILAHPEALELAYRAKRIDIADAAFFHRVEPMLHEVRAKHQLNDEDMRMSTILVSAIITSAFRAWMDGGKNVSADVLYEQIIRIVQHLH